MKETSVLICCSNVSLIVMTSEQLSNSVPKLKNNSSKPKLRTRVANHGKLLRPWTEDKHDLRGLLKEGFESLVQTTIIENKTELTPNSTTFQ